MTGALGSSGRTWRIAHSECSLGWGGQEHRVIAELAGFKRRGHEVALIAPESSQVFARAQSESIPTKAIPEKKARLIANVFSLANWLGKKRIDVLNTHSSKDGWFVALAGRLAGVPTIIRTRHIDVSYKTPMVNRHAFTSLADHVLTTSDRIRENLSRDLQLPLAHLTTLPTGIDIERFSATGPVAEALKTLKVSKRPLIGMVSVLRSWKGHRTFIAAAKQMIEAGTKADFVITGSGPQESNIKNWIGDTGHARRFHLLGHVEDVPGVLRGLDALVIPSYGHEGVPQIGLQALACETPVVGSDVGGIPEIILNGKTGRIFPAEDVAALRDRLTECLTQKSVTRCMTTAGRAKVDKEHNSDHMLNALDELYHQLAQDRLGGK